MLTTVVVTSLVLILLTLAPLLPGDHWLVRVWEFPRLQIAFLLLLNALVLAVLYLQKVDYALVLLMLNLTALGYQLYWILPYTPLQQKTVQAAHNTDRRRSIRVMNANVLMTNRNAVKLIELVKKEQPDILITLETNQWWQKALKPLHGDYPYRVNYPLENLYGMHVFSRLPLTDIVTAERVEKGVPSIHCTATLQSGDQINCHFVHPAPPSPTENAEATERDVELLGLAKEIATKKTTDHRSVIVSGDLNDVAWSPTTRAFLGISGLQDPRKGRGTYNTFHAQYAFARWPLDHIFHSDDFELVSLKRLSDIGSDHFPLLTELALTSADKSTAR